MALIAGIDEAGYGPILGPLVVSQVAFEVPDELLGRSLWSAFRGALTSRISKRDRRLPIVDSKKLYHPETGLAALERSALVMLATAGVEPATFTALMRALSPETLAQFTEYPWYERFDEPLPLEAEAAWIAVKANAINHNLHARGAAFLGATCRVLPEGHFNRLIESTRNKATVLWTQTLQLIERALRRPHDRVRVVVDRQGARIHCAQALMTAFDAGDLQIVEESPQRSAYRFGRRREDGSRQLVEIEFRPGGESRHLPIALASIYSKYIRELCMLAFNRYWQERVHALKRTAGYYQDGQRFLKDIEPAVRSMSLDRAMLVRSR